jgi:tetratricopeptide (TPR) repeat protein
VQAALQQGRECVQRGEYKSAVRILEAQLPRINGHAVYLAVLEDAYRGYVKELRDRGQTELAQRYLERLAILDPGVMLTAAVRPGTLTKEPSASLDTKEPGHDANAKPKSSHEPVAAVVQAGDQEFLAKHYYEAAGHYERAFQLDRHLSATTKERWAYCKLHWVTEQINNPSNGAVNWQALDKEVRAALQIAPRLEYGQTLLKAIQERTSPATTKVRYGVQHRTDKQNGWLVADSANFQVFHHDPDLAEKVIQLAEETRVTMSAQWLGERELRPWSVRCEIWVHPTAEAYCRATGAPPDSPGHSSIGAEKDDASRIHSRRIDLRADEPNLLRAVLPHEATHVVLAGHFGRKTLPRWADEGIAILSEPADRIDRHLHDLPRAFQEGRVFSVAQLMELDDYPGHQFMQTFYGQSAALVQFLVDTRDPRAVVELLRSAQREGYEAALRRHFGFRDYADLEQQWLAKLMPK